MTGAFLFLAASKAAIMAEEEATFCNAYHSQNDRLKDDARAPLMLTMAGIANPLSRAYSNI